MYIGKLDDIVNKHSNTYHNSIKVKHVDVKSKTCIDFGLENNDKDPKFKLVNMYQYQNMKTFLQKITFQIGLKMFFWLKKLKILFRGHA